MNNPKNSKESPKKLTFKQQMMLAREQAVIDVTNKLLASKGFDAMTVDEVADEVGIAKASLYRHFPSKEALGVAAMVNLMDKAVAFVDDVEPSLSAIEKLKAATRWTMTLKIQGDMPNLPSENSTLRTQLITSEDYMNGLMHISDVMGQWIEDAQKDKLINPKLPSHVVLFTLYARACDPVLGFLQQTKLYDDDQILDFVMVTCFEGLC